VSKTSEQAAVELAQQVAEGAIDAQARRYTTPDVELTQQLTLEPSQLRNRAIVFSLGGLALIAIAWWLMREEP
jgi:hypothetical protein